MLYSIQTIDVGMKVYFPAGTTVFTITDGQGKTLATLDAGTMALVKQSLVNLKLGLDAGGEFPPIDETTTMEAILQYIGVTPDGEAPE